MRDLHLLDNPVIIDFLPFAEVLHLSVDSDTDTIYVCTTNMLMAYNNSTNEQTGAVSLCERQDDSQCAGLQYLNDRQSACAAFGNGSIALWEAGTDTLPVAIDLGPELSAMAWSPDFELVVVTMAEDSLFMLTRDFVEVNYVDYFTDKTEKANPVTVGWGKKETQFHGSEGKQAAKVQSVVVGQIGSTDIGTPIISWRGDGQFFAVSAVEPVTVGRSVYIWSRDCVLLHKSEPVDGLHPVLSWKPSGSLIASVLTKRDSKELDVVLFERNGLRHGQFTIHQGNRVDMTVKQISWNMDSTLLAVLLENSRGISQVQLWSVNNYHWYLKQTLNYKMTFVSMAWDPEHAYRLHVITDCGHYLIYNWCWTTHCGLARSPEDLASVAVIDGDEVLVTPMRKMVLPPPMAAFKLKLPSPANFITFDPTFGSNDMAVLMANGCIAVFQYEENEKKNVEIDAAGVEGFAPKCDVPSMRELRFAAAEFFPLEKNHFLWISSTKFFYSFVSPSTTKSVVHIVHWVENRTVLPSKGNSFALDGFVYNTALNEDHSTVVIQLSCGELWALDIESETLESWSVGTDPSPFKFPYPCSQMSVSTLNGEEVALGLTDRFRFYINDIEVASNCSSFGVHNDFILLTTLDHRIKHISRSTKVADLPKLASKTNSSLDEYSRRVERGSRIVTVIGDDTKVVFQMPRGNLEVIHPRILVLNTLKNLMDSHSIQEAVLMMRKHRIDMNLLHDHNPSYFMDNLDDVVNMMKSVNHFNLFIANLIEEDVTQTMYAASYDKTKSVENHDGPGFSKVDRICDALIAIFKRMGEDIYLLPILTALVKKTNSEIEQALLLVWSRQGKETTPPLVNAVEALKFLLLLVDVNMLYDVALGTYNFDLVMMVAEKSQKDPKEYIPFLNHLRSLEENYQRYTIDRHLKKCAQALGHIVKCGDEHFEECVKLVCNHKLYTKALRLYKAPSKEYKRIALLYGNYLTEKNRHDEAGIMFLKAEALQEALGSFQSCLDWQQAFCVASKLKYSSNQTNELAVNLAGQLKQRQKFADAAIVYEDYAKDPEEAIVSLIEGCHWNESLRVMHRYNRLDLIETHLNDALLERYEQQMEMLTGQRELFDQHKSRLEVVRIQKETAQANLFGQEDFNDAEADLYSDTTSLTGASVASCYSGSTSRSRSTIFSKGSSRSKRKAESKKWSLKEGSPFEEFALMEALAKIIKCINEIREETNVLMKALIQFIDYEKARNLQEFYSEFLVHIGKSISQIWKQSSDILTQDSNTNMGPHSTANAIAEAVQKGQKFQEDFKPDAVLLIPPVLKRDNRWKLHMAQDHDI